MPKIYVSKHIFETNINDLIIKDLNNLQLVNKIEDQIINETNKKNYQNNFKVSDFTFEYEISNNNLIISFIVRSAYPELSYEIAKNMPIYIYDNIVEKSKTNSEAQISNFIVDEKLTRDLFFEHQKFLREHKLYKLKIIEDELLPLKQLIIKKKVFENYSFPKQFVTYSNNEYIMFSYNLYKKLEGTMIYTSKAKYRDIQTSSGRINRVKLMFQTQTYDLYIFLRLFDLNFINLLIYIKSRIGYLIYYLSRLIIKKNFSLKYYLYSFGSILYPLFNLKNIIKGDLTFYERDFPIE